MKRKLVSIIVAADKNNCIGINNDLPWGRLKCDMDHFKSTTKDSIVIMGSKTFESLKCKPLPKRINIVITSDMMKYSHINNSSISDNLIFVNSPEAASVNAKRIQEEQNKNIFIIGGASIYNYFWNIVDGIILTRIDKDFNGDKTKDTFINPVNENMYCKAGVMLLNNFESFDYSDTTNNDEFNVSVEYWVQMMHPDKV